MSTLPLAEIRRRFFDGDELPENSVPQPILHSWRRCLGLGLSAARLRPPERFNAVFGPLSVRVDEGVARVRIVPQPMHSNLRDNMHGGALLGAEAGR